MCPFSQWPGGPGIPATDLAAVLLCWTQPIKKFARNATPTEAATVNQNEEDKVELDK